MSRMVRSRASRISERVGAIEEYVPGRFRVAKRDSKETPKPEVPEGVNLEVEHYDSKTEAAYAGHLRLQQQAKLIARYWHHPFSLRLPGRKNRYTPDFLVEHMDGRLEVKETKGWSKNLRDGITKFKTASGVHLWVRRWTVVKLEEGQWIEREVRE